MSTPQPVTAEQIADFLQATLPDCRDVPKETVVSRVRWHMNLGQVLVVVDRAEEIIGAALGRFIDRIEEGPENYVNHPEGKIVWVDLIATLHPAALPALITQMKGRWNDRETVAGTVFNRNGELRVLPMQRLLKFIGG